MELALAVFGFGTSCLVFLGAPKHVLAWGAVGYVVLVYLAGVVVHSRHVGFAFVREGALGGSGYARIFRRAQQSLLLVHTDDDAPGDELLGLYRSLLAEGVELRRVIFLRSDQAPGSLVWVRDFGAHEKLKQRVVLPERADVMRMSFAIVDERWAILAIPGAAVIDGEGYAERFILKHLLVVDDSEVAEAFAEAHRQLWRRAVPVDDESLFGTPVELAKYLRLRRLGMT